MLEEHVRNEAVFKAMERSIHSARHVFNEYFYQTHQTKFVEYALLDSWYQFLNNEDLTGFNLDADMICKYSNFTQFYIRSNDFFSLFANWSGNRISKSCEQRSSWRGHTAKGISLWYS